MAGTKPFFRSLFYLCVLFRSYLGDTSDSLLCTNDFCEDYIESEGCYAHAQHEHCNYNNATHSGMWMPSPTPCNCCAYCLPFYNENEHCSLGGPGVGTTVGRCGDGLACVASQDGFGYCRRMETKCHAAQDNYDQRLATAQVGSLEERPRCDGKGRYAPYACVPTQTCFCQSEDGERLFGEALDKGSVEQQNMHCGCSRLNYRINKYIGEALTFPVVGPRCTSDGNFNPVQCVDKKCYCVDKITGQIVGSETISLEEKPVSELSCYDKDLDINPQQNHGDPPYNYTTECLLAMSNKVQFIQDSIEEGFNMDYFNEVEKCMPDGTYGKIGTTGNGTRICLDSKGQRIGDYEALPNSEQYDNMNCNCAATVLLMSSVPERPICCSNGNFRVVQCRRSKCRCVDENGRQIGRDEDDVTKLACYTNNWRSC